jgi:hypothetical protein
MAEKYPAESSQAFMEYAVRQARELIEHARRMERERDAARAALQAVVRQIEGYASTDEADKQALALARAALKGGAA